MTYEVTHFNPSSGREQTTPFDGKGLAREWVKRGRQYPGSFELISVVKITPTGKRTYVDL